jgi:hypothetical protein
MDDVDQALFDLLQPAPVTLPALAEPRLGAINAKWTRYNGAHRPCDLCTKRIHEKGVTGAPPPAAAAHKRVGPNDTLLLCNVDAEEQRRKDNAAEAKHKAAVAATGAKPGPGRAKSPKRREGAS